VPTPICDVRLEGVEVEMDILAGLAMVVGMVLSVVVVVIIFLFFF